jgi:hypothetical protein
MLKEKLVHLIRIDSVSQVLQVGEVRGSKSSPEQVDR